MLDKKPNRRLAVHVLCGVYGSWDFHNPRDAGCDVEAWIREELVDYIMPTPAGGPAICEHIRRFKELSGIRKERYKSRIIYFSSDPARYEAQHRNRFPLEPSAATLPPDAQAILILVEFIRHPNVSIDELAAQLRSRGYEAKAADIVALFQRYGIEKKN